MAHGHHDTAHRHGDHGPGPGNGQGHAHGHGHGADVDWAAMAPYLERGAELFAPLHAEAAAWLRRWQPEPELVVDAGSGPGVVTALLAEAFPRARTVAVDSSPYLLERARRRAERQGFADRLDTLEADLATGLDGLAYPADLIWASKAVHHVGDQRAALSVLAGRLAPGGVLALLEGGLPTRFLPRDFGLGRPGLQSRLDELEDRGFDRMRAELPGTVAEPEDWPALLAAAGLRHAATRTFLLDLPAPLPDAARAHVAATLAHRRDVLADGLDAEDLATVDRLLDPGDKESLHHRPDAFFLTAQTVYVGVRAEG